MISNSAIAQTVRRALDEDVGAGDLSAKLLPMDQVVLARVICRQDAVLCGRPWFEETFACVDPQVELRWQAKDGDEIRAGQVLCHAKGAARSIVTAERTALNFLQTLSGTATLTRRYANRIGGAKARLLDTRKTLPGLRSAQKYAVRCGGGQNHRMGLYDGILIKENHIRVAGSIAAALEQCRSASSTGQLVEVEVESLSQLQEALAAGATRILLDNFDVEMLRAAVRATRGQAELEASGNITLENIPYIAQTGVDYISVGALTKHVEAVDMSLCID